MEEKEEENKAIGEVIKALKEAKPIKAERKPLKENIKAIFYFIIKVLFFLSIFGFLFLILNDRTYGGGAVIFIFSIWGLIEYAKWVNKTFKIIPPKEETLVDKLKKEFRHLTPEQEEYMFSYFKSGERKTDKEIINELRKLAKRAE